jgi:competence protein ComEA
VFDQAAREPGPIHPENPSSEQLRLLAAAASAGLDPDAARSPAGRLVERWLPTSMVGPSGSPRRRRLTISVALLSVVAAILVTVVLTCGRPSKESPPPLPPAGRVPVAAAPAPPPRPVERLVVSVVGKVASPGLVTVPAGSRVADALAAAGGAAPGADLLSLNLARRLADGEQVAVGVPMPATDIAQAGSGAAPAKVDLNTASPDQLDTLPGVGEVTAKRIVDWRAQHGRFSTVEQLRDVDGIGESKFAKLRDQVTVG